MMLEYEKKMMLTADEYAAVSAMVSKWVFPQTQTNYYFDTDDYSMNKKGITCRIRKKDNQYVAIVKNHKTEHPDCSMEEVLCKTEEFCPGIFDALGLHYQGELVTERMRVYKDDVCRVVLDRNMYLGHTDYELEIEYEKGSEQKVQTHWEGIAGSLRSANVVTDIHAFLNRIGKSKCKSERFFERKKTEGR